ncbi:2-hydroxyacid dehydrogenase [Arthrobacter pigmenti]
MPAPDRAVAPASKTSQQEDPGGHIYVSRDLGPEPLDRLHGSGLEVVTHQDTDGPPTREELLRGARGAAAVVSLLTEPIDETFFREAGPDLKVVSTVAVGTDNIDLEAAARHNVVITNTPNVLTDATADLTLTLLLSLYRRVAEADAFLRRGGSWSWSPRLFLGRDPSEDVLGIIGFGRIGTAVARRALAFGMRVVVAGDRAKSAEVDGRQLERMSLPNMLGIADVVTLHCPLTAQTRHLLGADEFALMKPTAVILNTARGALIDEQEMIKALYDGRLRGVGLDVFEHEPHIPPEILAMPTTVVTPHIGSAGVQTRTRMALLAVDNALAVLAGRSPITPVG